MTLNDIMREMLIIDWLKLTEDIYLEPLDIDVFKVIFKNTWLYFMDVVENDSLVIDDIELINQIHDFSNLIIGLEGDICEIADKNDLWDEYFVCHYYVKGLLENIPQKSFTSGELHIEEKAFSMIVTLKGFDMAIDDDIRKAYERKKRGERFDNPYIC